MEKTVEQLIKEAEERGAKKAAKEILTAWWNTFGYVDDYPVFERMARKYNLYDAKNDTLIK